MACNHIMMILMLLTVSRDLWQCIVSKINARYLCMLVSHFFCQRLSELKLNISVKLLTIHLYSQSVYTVVFDAKGSWDEIKLLGNIWFYEKLEIYKFHQWKRLNDYLLYVRHQTKHYWNKKRQHVAPSVGIISFKLFFKHASGDGGCWMGS